MSGRKSLVRLNGYALVALLFVLMTVLLISQPVRSADTAGSLDPSFSGGSLTTSFPNNSDAMAVVVQSDGKLIVGGGSRGATDQGGFSFARYNPDGSLDTSFGADGTVTDIIIDNTTSRRVRALALQSDGKIIGSGTDGAGFAIVRLTASGSLDTSFGTDGIALTPGLTTTGDALGVAVQPDGRIIAVGALDEAVTVVRYNTDGSLDTAFDDDGIVSSPALGPDALARGVVIQSDGKIVVAGKTDQVTSALSDSFLIRFDTDGSMDTSFGTNGVAITNLGVGGAQAVQLLADGRIVTAGYAADTDWDWTVVLHKADGSLDTSFGGDGVVTTAFGATASAEGVVVEPDGGIIATGWVRTSSSPLEYEFALVRYESDGSLDTSFGDSGIVRTNPDIAFGADIVRQTDGRVVIAGSSSEPQFAVARFLTEGNISPVAVPDGPFSLFPGEEITGNVLDNDSDDDLDPLTAVKVSEPNQGIVTLNADGSFTYTAGATFSGTDSFTYLANDTKEDSNIAEVTFERSPNTPPVAVPDGPFVITAGDTLTGNVLDNDTDANDDALTSAPVMTTQDGTLKLKSNGDFTYIPDTDFEGSDSFTYTANDGTDNSNVAEVTIIVEAAPIDPDPPALIETNVGMVDPTTGQWYLRDPAGNVTTFYFGNPGDIPFMGDWNCDGVDTPGLFRQSDAFAYLRNTNSVGIADIRFFLGNPSDIPLAGDFNGDGCDTLSIYRPSEARFYIVNELGQNNGGLGAADYSFLFGDAGDKPVVGDWDGEGIDEIGLHRESNGFFYWRNSLTTGAADGSFFFGDPGDKFVAGDWGIVDGVDTPGLYRSTDTTLYFRHVLAQGNADSQISWDTAGPLWLPVAGSFGLG